MGCFILIPEIFVFALQSNLEREELPNGPGDVTENPKRAIQLLS